MWGQNMSYVPARTRSKWARVQSLHQTNSDTITTPVCKISLLPSLIKKPYTYDYHFIRNHTLHNPLLKNKKPCMARPGRGCSGQVGWGEEAGRGPANVAPPPIPPIPPPGPRYQGQTEKEEGGQRYADHPPPPQAGWCRKTRGVVAAPLPTW
jgi:hypothetical protein